MVLLYCLPASWSSDYQAAYVEVYRMIETFGDVACIEVEKTGFDAVEFHVLHRYLIAQFLSGHANKRTDKIIGKESGYYT